MTRRTILLIVMATACTRRAETGDTTQAKPDSAAPLASPPATPAAAPIDSPSVVSGAARPRSTLAAPTRDSSARNPVGSTSKGQPVVPTDTLRGIVAVVGTEHEKRVVIRPAGERAVTLAGPQALLVGRTSGADVWVSGSRGEAGTFTVSQFAVRTVDGIATLDGTLASEGHALLLVTSDGRRHTIANPPEALKQHIGGRVWISGNLSQGPVAYGIIQDKP